MYEWDWLIEFLKLFSIITLLVWKYIYTSDDVIMSEVKDHGKTAIFATWGFTHCASACSLVIGKWCDDTGFEVIDTGSFTETVAWNIVENPLHYIAWLRHQAFKIFSCKILEASSMEWFAQNTQWYWYRIFSHCIKFISQLNINLWKIFHSDGKINTSLKLHMEYLFPPMKRLIIHNFNADGIIPWARDRLTMYNKDL